MAGKSFRFCDQVLIRSSSDDWATHEDAYCTFVNSAVPSSVTVLYDTFSFRIPLPPRSRRLEFCVCFRAENQEYWDNNNGENYALVKKVSAGEIDAITEKVSFSSRYLLPVPKVAQRECNECGDTSRYCRDRHNAIIIRVPTRYPLAQATFGTAAFCLLLEWKTDL